ncbi:MAG: hypothetical protein R6U94_03070 [Nitriliruptoraceae bacterium]
MTLWLVIAVLAACGGTDLQTGRTEPQAASQMGPTVVDGVTVFVGGHETDGGGPEALLSGEVTIVDGCLAVVEPGGADGSVPLFPRGTVIEAGADGPVIRTPVGELTVGDSVGLGGGYIGGLDDDLGDCIGVTPAGGFSVFSIEYDPDM